MTKWYTENMNKDYYSIKEFANKLGVCWRTIHRGIKNGRISYLRIGSTSRSTYRIPHSEFSRIAEVDLQLMVDKMVEDKLKDKP